MPGKILTLLTTGLLALGGAALNSGPASAVTCPAGQHWNEMGGGAGFCSPDASGGGTGGNGSVNLGGKTPAAPKAPVFAQPKVPAAPVYKPVPAKPAAAVKVGTVLKADQKGWTKGTKLKFQWLRNGKAISKATSSSYKARAADKGAKLSVRVTGTRPRVTSTRTGPAYLVR